MKQLQFCYRANRKGTKIKNSEEIIYDDFAYNDFTIMTLLIMILLQWHYYNDYYNDTTIMTLLITLNTGDIT